MQVSLESNVVTEFNVDYHEEGLLEISPDKNTFYFAGRGLSPGTLAKYEGCVAKKPDKTFGADY
jgi:hypothetical protein